jgi:uncharacterized protein (DUF1800 family)
VRQRRHRSTRNHLSDDPERFGVGAARAGWRVIDPTGPRGRGSTRWGEADALANRGEWAYPELIGGGGQ